jgi:hypothetical protein
MTTGAPFEAACADGVNAARALNRSMPGDVIRGALREYFNGRG